FRVEQGVVRFSGDDPSDPALDIDAVYEGTDISGIRINVHVGGTAKDVKLELTSSPPKSQNEILAILVFGEVPPGTSMDGPSAQRGQGWGAAAGPAAVAVGGAVLTQGLNQLLSQSIIPIRASVSSTSGAASVQVSERIRVEYIRQLGATQYGRPQD